jgi:hypothetical protein
VLYESFIHPLTILSTLPSAGAGAVLFLMLFHEDMSLIALIGVLLLIGIMIVDFAISARRDRGLEPIDAIREACLLRFLPIMMTTMAAILGGVPLMLGSGAGSELRQPLEASMGRRPACQPAADLVHHAGHLSRFRIFAKRPPDACEAARRPARDRRGRLPIDHIQL